MANERPPSNEPKPKWFANRGQVIQALIAFAALLLGICVALPQLPVQQGIAGFFTTWPIIFFPAVTIGAIWFFNRRVSRTLEHFRSHKAGASAVEAAATTSLSEAPKNNLSTFTIPNDAVDVEKVTLKLGSYWERGPDMSRTRVTFSRLVDDGTKRPSVELAFDFGTGASMQGGTKTKRLSTNLYLVPLLNLVCP